MQTNNLALATDHLAWAQYHAALSIAQLPQGATRTTAQATLNDLIAQIAALLNPSAPESDKPRLVATELVRSSSGTGAYTVHIYDDGSADCECADYKYRHHDCKHIDYVR